MQTAGSQTSSDDIVALDLANETLENETNQQQKPQPSKMVEPDICREEPKIRTLRDYVEQRPKESPRGIDLEQIRASPRSEDLTKIKFARFVFNGVSTTVVSRSTKHMDVR